MTDLRNFLEDFAAPPPQTPAPAPADDTQSETEKLESFDAGYRAGWDDALKAQADDHRRIASDFAQNLQDLSFTYNEAYRQLLDGVTPLLADMLNSFLPEILRDSLGLHVHAQLTALAQQIGSRDVVITVAPGCTAQVMPLLAQDFGFPLRLEEDPTLSEGQADMRFGDVEQQIDLSGLLLEVKQAIEGFAHDNRREAAHG